VDAAFEAYATLAAEAPATPAREDAGDADRPIGRS
jgi:hypothetical protein